MKHSLSLDSQFDNVSYLKAVRPTYDRLALSKKLWSLPLININLKDLCERADDDSDEFVEEEDCDNEKDGDDLLISHEDLDDIYVDLQLIHGTSNKNKRKHL